MLTMIMIKFNLKSIVAFCAIALIASCSVGKNGKLSAKPDLVQTINKNLQDADAQYKVMMKNLQPDRFPKTYHPDTDKFETSGSDWWCSGFYPGTLLYLYEETKDQALYGEAQRILK